MRAKHIQMEVSICWRVPTLSSAPAELCTRGYLDTVAVAVRANVSWLAHTMARWLYKLVSMAAVRRALFLGAHVNGYGSWRRRRRRRRRRRPTVAAEQCAQPSSPNGRPCLLEWADSSRVPLARTPVTSSLPVCGPKWRYMRSLFVDSRQLKDTAAVLWPQQQYSSELVSHSASSVADQEACWLPIGSAEAQDKHEPSWKTNWP